MCTHTRTHIHVGEGKRNFAITAPPLRLQSEAELTSSKLSRGGKKSGEPVPGYPSSAGGG